MRSSEESSSCRLRSIHSSRKVDWPESQDTSRAWTGVYISCLSCFMPVCNWYWRLHISTFNLYVMPFRNYTTRKCALRHPLSKSLKAFTPRIIFEKNKPTRHNNNDQLYYDHSWGDTLSNHRTIQAARFWRLRTKRRILRNGISQTHVTYASPTICHVLSSAFSQFTLSSYLNYWNHPTQS